MGAVKLFQFDTLFSELIIMRNIKSYFGFKWLLSQVWDKKLLKITKRIKKKLVILKKSCETFPKKPLAVK